jgi:hypothetical protein
MDRSQEMALGIMYVCMFFLSLSKFDINRKHGLNIYDLKIITKNTSNLRILNKYLRKPSKQLLLGKSEPKHIHVTITTQLFGCVEI